MNSDNRDNLVYGGSLLALLIVASFFGGFIGRFIGTYYLGD
jgi:hypothetical protein